MMHNKPTTTIHSSRTIMFTELRRVMDPGIEDDEYIKLLYENVISKATQAGVLKTSRYLRKLYSFDVDDPSFKAFKFYWNNSEETIRPLLSLIYAIGNDYLLSDSISVIRDTHIGEKVTLEALERGIEAQYPSKYTSISRHSIAKNLASSWKQAGFITGKIKNIRTQPEISYMIVAFAFLLAYLNGIRGDYMLQSDWVKTLAIDEGTIRSLAIEAGKRDLLQYQYGGNVTSITFINLLNKLKINGFEN